MLIKLDNYDPNAEDNPDHDYPDIEEEDDRSNSSGGEEESDLGDYESDYNDDDEEDDYVRGEKNSKGFFE